MEWGLCICVRVYRGVGGVKVCVIGKLSVSEKVCESFYTMSFECVYASDACEYRNLSSMNVLVFAHTCYFACMSYR